MVGANAKALELSKVGGGGGSDTLCGRRSRSVGSYDGLVKNGGVGLLGGRDNGRTRAPGAEAAQARPMDSACQSQATRHQPLSHSVTESESICKFKKIAKKIRRVSYVFIWFALYLHYYLDFTQIYCRPAQLRR